MVKKYGVLCLLLVVIFTRLYAQDETITQERDLALAYGFDSVNGINSEWQPIVRTFEHDIEMVLVPPSSFAMGSTEEEVETAQQLCLRDNEVCNRRSYEIEMPQHQQTISEPFWIGRYEVSRAQYDDCVRDGLCSDVPDSPISTLPEHPINQVTWSQAKEFCESWSSGRLPTEVEWEHTARGPSNWTYPWGNDFRASNVNMCDGSCDRSWRLDSNDGFAHLAPVTTFSDGASWVGAYNLSGNVWEWVSTEFRVYPYNANDGRERTSNVQLRVIRGGSYVANVTLVRTHARFWFTPTTGGNGIGFRCVRDVF